MKLLQCFNHALVDISPLTQIGSVAILAWVGVLIARRYRIRQPWMAAFVAFLLGAQPFYLENLSFKFDSLSMSMAVFFALLPILTLKEERKGWWLGILCLFVSLNLYQTAINVYLIFILLDVALAKLHDTPPRELWLQFRTRALQAGMGMLVYQLITGIHIGGWVKQETVAIHSVAELPLIANNVINYCRFIGSSFNVHWWMYIIPVLVLLLFSRLPSGYDTRSNYAAPSHYGLGRRYSFPACCCLWPHWRASSVPYSYWSVHRFRPAC